MGVEAVRKDQLIRATIQEIGAAGTAQVTVSQIAKRAGVSSALAFHYFGDKEQLFLSAMRHILKEFQKEARKHLAQAKTPFDRLAGVIDACFAPSNFVSDVVNAWLVFYVVAQQNDEAARLLRVYHRRLHSTLIYDLKAIGVPDPARAADGLGAMIDGLYIRQSTSPENAGSARALIGHYLDQVIGTAS